MSPPRVMAILAVGLAWLAPAAPAWAVAVVTPAGTPLPAVTVEEAILLCPGDVRDTELVLVLRIPGTGPVGLLTPVPGPGPASQVDVEGLVQGFDQLSQPLQPVSERQLIMPSALGYLLVRNSEEDLLTASAPRSPAASSPATLPATPAPAWLSSSVVPASGVTDWVTQNGFAKRAELQAWAAPYVTANAEFVVVSLSEGRPERVALRMAMRTDAPRLCQRRPADQPPPTSTGRLWAVTPIRVDARLVPWAGTDPRRSERLQTVYSNLVSPLPGQASGDVLRGLLETGWLTLVRAPLPGGVDARDILLASNASQDALAPSLPVRYLDRWLVIPVAEVAVVVLALFRRRSQARKRRQAEQERRDFEARMAEAQRAVDARREG